MVSEKLEDILNLSLESGEGQRQRSDVLDVGFDRESGMWELIVKYSGDLERLRQEGVGVERLLAGYAIVTLPQEKIPLLVQAPEVEYVEMPKRLLEEVYEAKRVSCILPLTGSGACAADVSCGTPDAGCAPREGSCADGVREEACGAENADGTAQETSGGGQDMRGDLSGSGVLIAVLDSGIDYYLEDFRDGDGGSRIAWLWDQTLTDGRFAPPEGFSIGAEFSKPQIDAALAAGSRQDAFSGIPSVDRSGHGTSVAAVAAGGSRDPLLQGVAVGAQLLVVKLADLRNGFPRTTELMRAVTWSLRKARQMGRPLVINISFGNTCGPHDGSALLSRFLDSAAEEGRTVICAGSGNEGASSGHAAGRLVENGSGTVELVVADYERTLSLQVWKNYADSFAITLVTPSGDEIPVRLPRENGMGPFPDGGRQDVIAGDTEVLIYVGQPSPYSVRQEIFFDLLPVNSYIEAGVWSVRLEALRIVSGGYQMYLPGQEVRAPETRFVRPVPELTLTVPSTAAKVLTVGAYQPFYESYADFSGRGAPVPAADAALFEDVKPDLAAPGVDILTVTSGGGVVRVSGTSFAAPIVTGASALLMEWGIVRGNDPYLYGEKMKAYLRRGARPLRGEDALPNNRVGYGALCAAGSLPQ